MYQLMKYTKINSNLSYGVASVGGIYHHDMKVAAVLGTSTMA